MNKTLLFDFDGVLVNSFEISFSTSMVANRSWKSRKHYRQLFNGNVYNGLKTAKTIKKNYFFSIYGPKLMDLELVKDAQDILRALSKEYRLIIISSTPKGLIKSFFNKHKVLKYFKEILGSDFHKSKIHKINFVLKKYKLKSEECIFITDTLGDIIEAKKCGIKSIAITGGFHFRSALRKGKPIKIVRNISDLPKTINKYFKTDRKYLI